MTKAQVCVVVFFLVIAVSAAIGVPSTKHVVTSYTRTHRSSTTPKARTHTVTTTVHAGAPPNNNVAPSSGDQQKATPVEPTKSTSTPVGAVVEVATPNFPSIPIAPAVATISSGLGYSFAPRLTGSAHPRTVVIAGLVKDAEASLPSLLHDLTDIACLFSDASFVVLESNSKDNTLAVLNDFAAHNQQACLTTGRQSFVPFREIKVISSKPAPNSERIHRLVYYRNELREHLFRGLPSDYTMMVDMDVSSVDLTSLQQHLPSYLSEGFSAVCLNDHFRDSFAMVSADNKWAFPDHVRVNKFQLAVWDVNGDIEQEVHRKGGSRSGALEVNSCFNAATFYKSAHYLRRECVYKSSEDAIVEDVRFAAYTSAIDNNQLCEHVYFHDCLRRASASFKMGLSLYNDYVTHVNGALMSNLVQLEGMVDGQQASPEKLVSPSLKTLRKWTRDD